MRTRRGRSKWEWGIRGELGRGREVLDECYGLWVGGICAFSLYTVWEDDMGGQLWFKMLCDAMRCE